MSSENQEVVCLNECSYDYDTGYCLSCGRPPLPPEAMGAPSDASNLLAKMLLDPTFGVKK
jgi:hypothetical protein